MNDKDYAIKRLSEINEKNKFTNEYSLGDVILLSKYEKILTSKYNFTQEQVEKLSPSYYG
jgi:hypothetical protein